MYFFEPSKKYQKNGPQTGGRETAFLIVWVCGLREYLWVGLRRNIVHCIVVAISKLPPPLYNTQHSLKANPLKSSLQSISPTPPMCNAESLSHFIRYSYSKGVYMHIPHLIQCDEVATEWVAIEELVRD